MAWIESHQSLSRHRKTIRAVGLLKVDRHKLLGHLHELWWWALDNVTPDGELGTLSAAEIAEAAGWPQKDAGRFVQALVAAGFLDRLEAAGDAEHSIHDWYVFAGKYADKKEANAQRQQKFRERARNALRNAPDVDDETAGHGATGEDRRGPDLTSSSPPGQEGEGEEARVRGPETVVPPDALQAFHQQLAALPGYEPSEAFYTKLGSKYGHLDLEEEALKMADWLHSEKGRGKECSTRFVLHWLRQAAADHAARPIGRNGTAGPAPRGTTRARHD